MTHPDPHADDRALQEVRDAYRNLPRVEPDATLDARVRAAVGAEVAPAEPGVPGRRGAVIPYPKWRRAALPFAAAAAVLVAIGIDQSQRPRPDLAPMEVQFRAQLARAPAAASAPTPVPAPADGVGGPSPPNYTAPPPVTPPPVLVPPVTGVPAPMTASRAQESALYARAQRPLGYADGYSAEAKLGASLAAVAPAPPLASGPPASSPVQAIDDSVTFDEIRRLLSERHGDDARRRLRRWREAHPGAALPADLESLAAELNH